jgi:hypothetical protein
MPTCMRRCTSCTTSFTLSEMESDVIMADDGMDMDEAQEEEPGAENDEEEEEDGNVSGMDSDYEE